VKTRCMYGSSSHLMSSVALNEQARGDVADEDNLKSTPLRISDDSWFL
jgi:hypothetical protein